MAKKRFRRKFLINRKFQYSFLGYMILIALLVGANFYIANLYLVDGLRELASENGLASDSRFIELLESHHRMVSFVHLITGFLSVLVVVAGGLIISNRVAGPIYRLTEAIRQREHGNIGQLKFRKDDYFQDLADSYNKSVAEIPPQTKKSQES